MPTAVSQ